jgi:hypothetical protein
LFERNIFVLKWYFVTIQDFCPKTDFCLNTIGRYFCPQNVFCSNKRFLSENGFLFDGLIIVGKLEFCSNRREFEARCQQSNSWK